VPIIRARAAEGRCAAFSLADGVVVFLDLASFVPQSDQCVGRTVAHLLATPCARVAARFRWRCSKADFVARAAAIATCE
jgi:hypothetical protein